MSYISTCLADGAVGLWVLGESSGLVATDQAGNSNGAYSASGVVLGQPGIAGGGGATATKFVASSNGMVTIPDVAAQHVANSFTLEVWLKRNTTGSFMALIGGATNFTPAFRLDAADHIQAFLFASSDIALSSVTLTDTSIFHHVVWTHADELVTSQHIYLDGVDVTGSTTAAGVTSNTAGLLIGMEPSTQWAQDGTIGMGAIYPTGLSSVQVLNHYTTGSSVPVVPAVTVPGPPPLLGRMGR